MARHRQPREVAELKGAHKKDPQRYGSEAAKCDAELGEAPVTLPEGAVAAWDELVANCLPGVLTGADRFILEIAARLLSELREAGTDIKATKLNMLISCLARLGYSPADRQKFDIEKPEAWNVYDHLED